MGPRFATSGSSVKLWELPAQTPVRELHPHKGGSNHVAWSANRDVFISAGDDGAVAAHTADGLLLRSLKLPEEEKLYSCTFSHNSRLIAAGGEKGKVYIWDIRSGKLYKTLEGHTAAVSCVVFNSADTHVISGSFGGDIIVHNLTSTRASPPLRASEKAVRCLVFSPTQRGKRPVLVSASDDGSVQLWDSVTHELKHSFLRAHHSCATGLAFSPVSETLMVSVGLDQQIVFYDIVNKNVLKKVQVKAPLTAVACVEDGTQLIVGTSLGMLQVLDVHNNFEAHEIAAHRPHPIACIAYPSPNTRLHPPPGPPDVAASKTASTAPAAPTGSASEKRTALGDSANVARPAANLPAYAATAARQSTTTTTATATTSPRRNLNLSTALPRDTSDASHRSPASSSTSSVFARPDPILPRLPAKQGTSAVGSPIQAPYAPASPISARPAPTSAQPTTPTRPPLTVNMSSSAHVLSTSAATRPVAHHDSALNARAPEVGTTPPSSATKSKPVPEAANVPLEYIKIMIEDALEAQRLTIHKEIVNLHMDMLRQFEQQKLDMEDAARRYSVNDALVEEIVRLRDENARLRATY